MQKNSDVPIKTFTIGFKEDDFNEANYAKKIANYLGTDHNELFITIDDLKNSISLIPKFYDEPFADNSSLATMIVSKFAKDKVSVALSGDGGDELFCGYTRYQRALELEKLQFLSKIYKKIPLLSYSLYKIFKDKNFIKLKFLDSHSNIINSDHMTFNYLYKGLVKNLDKINHKYKKVNTTSKNIQEKYMLSDMLTYLPDDILTKLDRASMSVSLEARVPILDYRIVELALSLDHNYKYNNGDMKWILKEIINKYLPKELIDRPKKGFSIPFEKWLREDLDYFTKNYFDETFIVKQNIFDYNIIKKIINNFKENNRSCDPKLVWNIIIFQLWFEEYMT
jgi:asparagine synthase (glutamine-hydrolysing)